jgi:hypothetical protein
MDGKGLMLELISASLQAMFNPTTSLRCQGAFITQTLQLFDIPPIVPVNVGLA